MLEKYIENIDILVSKPQVHANDFFQRIIGTIIKAYRWKNTFVFIGT